MAPETGLVPITLASLGDQGSGTYGDQPGLRGRPWDSGELDNPYPLADADRVDVPTLLAEYWEDSVEQGEDEPELLAMLGPFGREIPGLAPALDRPLSDEELAAALRLTRPARLGLVPASRPADVLSLTGFVGLTNRGTPAEFTAVLRGWEERFGAVLYEVGFADVRVLVTRPPRTMRAAEPSPPRLPSCAMSSGPSSGAAPRLRACRRSRATSRTRHSGDSGGISQQ